MRSKSLAEDLAGPDPMGAIERRLYYWAQEHLFQGAVEVDSAFWSRWEKLGGEKSKHLCSKSQYAMLEHAGFDMGGFRVLWVEGAELEFMKAVWEFSSTKQRSPSWLSGSLAQ